MVILNENIANNQQIANISTFAHELGHSFGLMHTHEFAGGSLTNPFREQVSRDLTISANCSNTGDIDCSTKADYGPDGQYAPIELRGVCNNRDNCIGTLCVAKDNTGVPLGLTQPDYRNIMSYHNPFCQPFFTAEQQVTMTKSLFYFASRSFLLRSVEGIVESQCSSPLALANANINVTIAYNAGAISTNVIPCQPNNFVTNTAGNFNTCGLNPGRDSLINAQRNYQQIATLTAVKNSDLFNGLTTFDVSLISQHILDITPFNNPYKIVAADVDNSGELDVSDMLYLRQLILRQRTTFPNGVGSWRFVPRYYLANAGFSSGFNTNPFTATYNNGPQSFTYLGANSYLNKVTLNLTTTSTAQENWSFNAVKMGDINCTAVNTAARMMPNRLTNLDNKAVSIKSGKEATVLIKAKYAGKISTFQAGFNFTNSAVQISSIEKGDFNSSNDAMDFVKQDNGVIRMLWYNEKAKAKNFTPGVTILKLKVKALKDIADLLSVLSLDNAVLESEFYDDKNLPIQMELTLEADGSNAPISNDSYSVKVYPNPFSNRVTIEVTSATKENAALTIVSAMGAPVYNKRVALEVGVNTIDIENTTSFPTGVLSYSIQFGNRTLNGTINKSR
jgi:hypothetical protein